MRRMIGFAVVLAVIVAGCPDKGGDAEARAEAEKAVAEAEKALAGAAKKLEEAKAAPSDVAPAGVPPDLARFFTEFVRVRVEKDLDGLWMMMSAEAQERFADSIETMKEETKAAIEKDPKNAKKRVPKVLVPGEEFLKMEVKDAYAAATAQQLTEPVIVAYKGAKLVSASKAADGKSAEIRFSQADGKQFDLSLAAGDKDGWLVLKKAPAAPAAAVPAAAVPAAAAPAAVAPAAAAPAAAMPAAAVP